MPFNNRYQQIFLSKSIIPILIFVTLFVEIYEQLTFYLIATEVTVGDANYNLLPNRFFYDDKTVFACYLSTTPHRDILYYSIVIYIVVFVSMTFMFFHLTLKMVNSEKHTKTGKLQYMLHKAFAVQLLNCNIMLLWPSVIILLYLCAMWEDNYGVTSICFSLMFSHGVVDMIVMIYFITPWRRAVVDRTRKIFWIKKSNNIQVQG